MAVYRLQRLYSNKVYLFGIIPTPIVSTETKSQSFEKKSLGKLPIGGAWYPGGGNIGIGILGPVLTLSIRNRKTFEGILKEYMNLLDSNAKIIEKDNLYHRVSEKIQKGINRFILKSNELIKGVITYYKLDISRPVINLVSLTGNINDILFSIGFSDNSKYPTNRINIYINESETKIFYQKL